MAAENWRWASSQYRWYKVEGNLHLSLDDSCESSVSLADCNTASYPRRYNYNDIVGAESQVSTR